MQRFFIEQELKENDSIQLSAEIHHQCKNVLRYQNGQSVELIDQKQNLALATLEFKQEGLFAHIQNVKHNTELGLKIVLIQALIKKDKWEFVLQKATELGVSEIIPLICQRNVVKWTDKELKHKLQRDEKIIKEASEQSERLSIPKLYPPQKISDLTTFKQEANFVAYENEEKTHLKHVLNKQNSFSIVIGPEGGFTNNEIKELNALGFSSVGLGPRILRAETASLVAINTIQTIIEP